MTKLFKFQKLMIIMIQERMLDASFTRSTFWCIIVLGITLSLISTACTEPLGMENRQLKQLSGSSHRARWNSIRLNNNQPWYPLRSDNREFLQVVIKPYGKTVTALTIQGNTYWIISFTLRTSQDGSEWHDYLVNGNIEVTSVST